MYNVVSRTFEGPFDVLLDFAKDDDIDVARIAVLDIV